jgi:hypothetical protein
MSMDEFGKALSKARKAALRKTANTAYKQEFERELTDLARRQARKDAKVFFSDPATKKALTRYLREFLSSKLRAIAKSIAKEGLQDLIREAGRW